MLDRRVATQRRQCVPLALELLQQVGLEIGASCDVEDLEHGHQRHVMRRGVRLRQEDLEAVEEILEPQQRPDALVEWVLVLNQWTPADRNACEERVRIVPVDEPSASGGGARRS